MQILSVNIGRPEHVEGHTALTGICKRPVAGPVAVGPLGVEGDAVMDTKNHGGLDQAVYLYGRVVDVACRRHWVDPTEPLRAAVLAPAHGVLVTSATLADSALEDPFALAEMRTGSARLPERPKTLRLASPFDYSAH